MRKLRIIAVLLALGIFGISACAQKTCPTYTKDDMQKQEFNEKDV
jgi:hypothetical protein